MKVLNSKNEVSLNHLITQNVKIEFIYQILTDNNLFTHGFNLFNSHNIHILSSHDFHSNTLIEKLSKGIYKKTITIPANFLADGSYDCSFAVMKYNPYSVEFNEENVVGFTIIDEIGNRQIRGDYTDNIPGIVRPILNWK